jgi:hypothetical protein
MQVFFGLSYHGHCNCVVFTCELLQVIARTVSFDESRRAKKEVVEHPSKNGWDPL